MKKLKYTSLILLLLLGISFGGSIRILIDTKISSINRSVVLQEIMKNLEIYRVSAEILSEDLSQFYENYINLGDEYIERYMLQNNIDLLNFVHEEEDRITVYTFTNPKKDFVSETCYIPRKVVKDNEVLIKSVVSCLLKNMYALGRLNAEGREL
ncbi:MAG: hypothetical protein DSY42_02615 [Aquifex sp.]|nr:MAG: hypothetical protein DSY42_02615 [Aquifex sp.]